MSVDENQIREKKELEAWRDDPRHWRGLFYFNKGDNAVFIRGRFGVNTTMNFANPWTYVLLALILGAVAAAAIAAN